MNGHPDYFCQKVTLLIVFNNTSSQCDIIQGSDCFHRNMSTRNVFLTHDWNNSLSLSKQSLRTFLLLSRSSETNWHLFVFPVSRSLTIAQATRFGTSWLPGHIIGPLLVLKVTQRQASASYIRKPRPSQEWNICRWVGAAVASRISWRARTWRRAPGVAPLTDAQNGFK